jgi:hypothetical protein
MLLLYHVFQYSMIRSLFSRFNHSSQENLQFVNISMDYGQFSNAYQYFFDDGTLNAIIIVRNGSEVIEKRG